MYIDPIEDNQKFKISILEHKNDPVSKSKLVHLTLPRYMSTLIEGQRSVQ
jgi:hypothetical protein